MLCVTYDIIVIISEYQINANKGSGKALATKISTIVVFSSWDNYKEGNIMYILNYNEIYNYFLSLTSNFFTI